MIIAFFDNINLYQSNNTPIETTSSTSFKVIRFDQLLELNKTWDFFTPNDDEQKHIINHIAIQTHVLAMRVIDANFPRIEAGGFLQAKSKEVDGLELRNLRRVERQGWFSEWFKHGRPSRPHSIPLSTPNWSSESTICFTRLQSSR